MRGKISPLLLCLHGMYRDSDNPARFCGCHKNKLFFSALWNMSAEVGTYYIRYHTWKQIVLFIFLNAIICLTWLMIVKNSVNLFSFYLISVFVSPYYWAPIYNLTYIIRERHKVCFVFLASILWTYSPLSLKEKYFQRIPYWICLIKRCSKL
jgi:hypothetical protein